MASLSSTWFTEGRIDFELKKYVLLNYLQDVNRHFYHNKLYPQMSDLILHYQELCLFKHNKKELQEQFPGRIVAANIEDRSITYEQLEKDAALLEEVWAIVDYSIGEMSSTLQEGKEIFEFVEAQISISPVGLLSLNASEGYFLLGDGKERSTRVYQYRTTIFENHQEQYRGLHARYLKAYPKKLNTGYEMIKGYLLKEHPELPNPAVYAIDTSLAFPLEETLLPIAKRSLMKYLAKAQE